MQKVEYCAGSLPQTHDCSPGELDVGEGGGDNCAQGVLATPALLQVAVQTSVKVFLPLGGLQALPSLATWLAAASMGVAHTVELATLPPSQFWASCGIATEQLSLVTPKLFRTPPNPRLPSVQAEGSQGGIGGGGLGVVQCAGTLP